MIRTLKHVPGIIAGRSKLLRKFNIKDKTPFEEQHDLLYRAVCAISNCIEDYVGETVRHIVERTKDRNGRDQHFFLVKHAIEHSLTRQWRKEDTHVKGR